MLRFSEIKTYEKELFNDLEETLKISLKFRDRIDFAEVSWLTESEALTLFESQLEIIETIKDLVNEHKFIEAFILNRTIFENYFLISLILNGIKYKIIYNVPTESNETSEQAYTKLENELKKQISQGRKDIVSFKPVKKFKKIEIIHKGLYSSEGDKIIPIYYFVFQEYDPIRHRIDKIKSISSKELFSEYLEEWHKKHKTLYNIFLKFENILNAAVLNKMLTDEEKIRVNVHYNFLSGFTHLTKKGSNLTKSFEWKKNKHYLLELNLLYALRILRLYFLLIIDYFSKTNHQIQNCEELLFFLDKLDRKYNYFWFIYNQPTEYDSWRYQTSKEFHAKKGRLLDEKIPYYKDPFERLKGQHQIIKELSTGQIYQSPWSKHDYSF